MPKRRNSTRRGVRKPKLERGASRKPSASVHVSKAQTAPLQSRANSSREAPSARNAAQQNAAEAKFSKSADSKVEAALRRASSSSVAAWLSSPGSARTIIDLTHDAVIICSPANVIEAWNVAAEGLYGWTPKEAIGKTTHALLETVFPVSMEATQQALAKNGYWEGELQHRRKDGKRIAVLSRQSLLRTSSGLPLLVKEINRDVTQERRQLGYLRLLKEGGDAVSEAQSVSEALRRCLASICVHTSWCVGRAFALGPDGSIEYPDTISWFTRDERRFGAIRDVLQRKLEQNRDGSPAARALRSNSVVSIPNLSADPYFKSIPEIAKAGLVSAFAQPVYAGAAASAVIVLYSDGVVEIDQAFLSAMSSVAGHLRRFFERLAAEEVQRKLSVSLMRAQDDERRRIARELHDSTGQYLGAMGLAIEAARRAAPDLPGAAAQKLDEAGKIIERCSAELRTLSHLLHPPLLEELGLPSALKWCIDGFTERSGIEVSANVPQLPRLSQSAELTLFRILQECLTNIHRHSGSKTATVKVEAGPRSLTLEVCDQGKGIPAATLRGWFRNTERSGVGISGMRERLKDLGGAFEINSNEMGTTVRATIPLRADAASVADAAAPAQTELALASSAGSTRSSAAAKSRPATAP